MSIFEIPPEYLSEFIGLVCYPFSFFVEVLRNLIYFFPVVPVFAVLSVLGAVMLVSMLWRKKT